MKEGENIALPKWIVPILLFIVAQGFAATIYVARLGTEVGYLGKALAELKLDVAAGIRLRYTSEDATKDKAIMHTLLESINKRIDLAEKRIEKLEDKKP